MKNLFLLVLDHCSLSFVIATTHDVFLVGAHCCDTVYANASLGDTVFVLTNNQFGLPNSIDSPDFERAGLESVKPSLTWVTTRVEHRATFKGPSSWMLYDFRGRIVREGDKSVREFTIERNQLPSGVYFIYYKDKNRDAIHKFLN